MVSSVVKIDLCNSKAFSNKQEIFNPSIRTEALTKMIDVAKNLFPNADKLFPSGSFYKADGDSVYYIIENPTIALRSAIEFMQSWYKSGLQKYPDCRIYIDIGYIEKIDVPGRQELTGKAFDNISIFEKGLNAGKIYITRDVIDKVDKTIAKFIFYQSFSSKEAKSVDIYIVDFLDPRTFSDSSILHALFIAHPKSSNARDRLFELFFVEFLLEKDCLADIRDFIYWAKRKNYPIPQVSYMNRVLNTSSFIEKRDGNVFTLRPEAKADVQNAMITFSKEKEICKNIVKNSIINETGRQNSVDGIALDEMIEEYLCAIFAEIRIMANYFRSTLQYFDNSPEHFAQFDYVIKRYLDDARIYYYLEWRRGFLIGLRNVSAKQNLYIAAIFHNVLAAYYLNRIPSTSFYQADKLTQRQIFLDTNIIYSMLVPASSYHEVTNYFVQRLSKLNVYMRIFFITLDEYEEHLAYVERNVDARGRPSPLLVRKNPWLWQEYKINPAKYLTSFAFCRSLFSLAKDVKVEECNFNLLFDKLKNMGVRLEKHELELTDSEIDELWTKLRNEMASDWWDLDKYWDFILRERPQQVKRHDIMLIKNVEKRALGQGNDELGPKVLLLTVDKKLWRLRRKYPFILSPEQFLEFMLPYMFICDIPFIEADKFPNQLLHAQLGTLLVRRPPELTEIVSAYFNDPPLTKENPQVAFGEMGETMAKALSNQRFKDVVCASTALGDLQKDKLSEEATIKIKEFIDKSRIEQDAKREVKVLEKKLSDKDNKINKLLRTLRYWKKQARKK
jgi:hypothetical protein